mmetsp:Transcript_30943/g.57943  ORF Transcript_30943/g.57943 Transcript_30943/m.57943 type:complete len:215 (-) Transcript_30943:167-811(-)
MRCSTVCDAACTARCTAEPMPVKCTASALAKVPSMSQDAASPHAESPTAKPIRGTSCESTPLGSCSLTTAGSVGASTPRRSCKSGGPSALLATRASNWPRALPSTRRKRGSTKRRGPCQKKSGSFACAETIALSWVSNAASSARSATSVTTPAASACLRARTAASRCGIRDTWRDSPASKGVSSPESILCLSSFSNAASEASTSSRAARATRAE